MKIDLSNSEWKLMNRLWQTSPMTITELTAALKEETGWSKNTVITMLSRLEGKEAVRHEEGRRAKLYFPAVDREDAIEAETETFLDKIGGDLQRRDGFEQPRGRHRVGHGRPHLPHIVRQ